MQNPIQSLRLFSFFSSWVVRLLFISFTFVGLTSEYCTFIEVEIPCSVQAGTNFTVQAKLRNTSSSVYNSSTAYVYLSSDRFHNAEDRFLGTYSVGGSVPNQTHIASKSFYMPSSTLAGTYYVIIQVGIKQHVEKIEVTGNAHYGRDLIVKNLSFYSKENYQQLNPYYFQRGKEVWLKYEIENRGTSSASYFRTRAYISKDRYVNSGDYILHTKGHNFGIDGNSISEGFAQAIMPHLTTGSYYLIIQTDIDNQINEQSYENNNIYTYPIFIQAANIPLSSDRSAPQEEDIQVIAPLSIEMAAYPNPTKGILTLDLEILEDSDLHGGVFDSTGKLKKAVHIENLKEGSYSHQLDLSDYRAGTYFIDLHDDKGHRAMKKVIVSQ